MFNLQFIKSIIEVHNHYKSNNFSNDSFLIMIDKCFKNRTKDNFKITINNKSNLLLIIKMKILSKY